MAFGVFGKVRSVALEAHGVFMIQGWFLDGFVFKYGFRKATGDVRTAMFGN